ncbi:hypothetical protein JHK85_004996 [Glycine max]|nr:hypothetical protein JHK85_004996 [Glycine max]
MRVAEFNMEKKMKTLRSTIDNEGRSHLQTWSHDLKARRQGETLVIQVALALDHAVAKHLLVTTEKSVILDDSDNHALEYKEKKVLL